MSLLDPRRYAPRIAISNLHITNGVDRQHRGFKAPIVRICTDRKSKVRLGSVFPGLCGMVQLVSRIRRFVFVLHSVT
jgi:hypothetical protein